MYIEEDLNEIKMIQNIILNILDDEDNFDQSIEVLNQKISMSTLPNNTYKMVSLFQMITHIANEHHRGPNFFWKIEQILNIFKKEIASFSNSEIFEIFKGNKRVLLYLIKEKLLKIDDMFVETISRQDSSYCQYFAKEIKDFKNNQDLTQLPDNYEENREIGENDSYICKMIRKDSVVDFITYINTTNYPLKGYVPHSIFETNSLLTNSTSLIEYAAFYGSIQIFQYLKYQEVPLSKSLVYAIHSNNPEIINICEDDTKDTNLIREAFYESIKCFHTDIFYYFKDKYDSSYFSGNYNEYEQVVLEFNNFEFINIDMVQDENVFCYFCYYNYCWIVEILAKRDDFDMNHTII